MFGKIAAGLPAAAISLLPQRFSTMKRYCLCRFVALFLICLCVGPVSGQTFSFTTLDDPNGIGETFPAAISGNIIVGMYDESLNSYGFVFDGTTYTTLNDPLGVNSTQVWGISGSNIVGYYFSTSDHFESFVYSRSTFSPLGPPGALDTQARGISGNEIVGNFDTSPTSNTHGFLYNGSTFIQLDDPLSAKNTNAFAVSGNLVVGLYQDSLSHNEGFVYNISTSAYTTLNDPAAGVVTAIPYGVDGNDIVGEYADASGNSYSFFYDGSTWTTINVPGSVQTSVSGITDGKIVGFYESQASPFYHGFEATIVPEPSTFALSTIGAVSLLVYSWRRRTPDLP